MDYCGLLIVEKNSIANLKLNLPGGVAESTVSRAGGSFGDGWQLAKPPVRYRRYGRYFIFKSLAGWNEVLIILAAGKAGTVLI